VPHRFAIGSTEEIEHPHYSLLKDIRREAARLIVALVLVAVPIAIRSVSNGYYP
jgi:hypothetical protein